MTKIIIPTSLALPTEIKSDFCYIKLGAWCDYLSKSSSLDFKAELVKYHWDDRNKIFSDYQQLSKLYEELVLKISNKLNSLHGVRYSTRYWRIIIGPWLGYFVQVLFDRWEIVQSAALNLSECEFSYFQEFGFSDFIPNDMKEFNQVIDNDVWNQYMFQLVMLRSEDFFSAIPSTRSYSISPLKPRRDYLWLKNKLNKISKKLFLKSDIFIISSYLSVAELMKVQFRIKQFPTFWFRRQLPNFNQNREYREWVIDDLDIDSKFSKFLCELIPLHMPKSYLEGYNETHQLSLKEFPNTTKAIFDCNSWNTDDLTKFWMAWQVENGALLMIGQHGGNYGQSKWNFSEDHQVAICDKFLTWGWEDSQNNKVVPVGIHKMFGKKTIKPKMTGGALMAQMGIPRFSQNMYSVPIGMGQWLRYFEDQCTFLKCLPNDILKKVTIRLYPTDGGLQQKKRWGEVFYDIELDDGSKFSFMDALSQSRIYIATYNATTYLETLSLNFPTILFWDNYFWELRSEAQPFFEQLEAVGIFHATPESAAKQLSEIWNDVDGWWFSSEVQDAVKEFSETFCRYPIDPIGKLSKELKIQG